ncbi:MAG: PKD domain-containing protein, partial [Chitinophagaceae bacterium]
MLYCALFHIVIAPTAFAQTAAFTASTHTGCWPQSVSFTDHSTGTITAWNWNVGNSTSIPTTTQSPSVTYSSPGTYYVSLTVTGPGGTSTPFRDTIVISDYPVSTITATPISDCTPLTVQFTSAITANSVGPLTTIWDFGDGNTGTGTTASHTYYTPGTYPVKLSVTNGAGCGPRFSPTVSVTAFPIPTASFSASRRAFCDSTNAVDTFISSSFGGTKPYRSLSWNFGDGGTGSGDTVVHRYLTGGAFSVSLTVTDAHGCYDIHTSQAYITVNTAKPTFSGNTTICLSDLANYTNTTSGSSNTSWDFGDGYTVSNSASATHFYTTAGTYTMSMTTSIGGCPKTVSKTVIVNANPTANFTYLPAVPCPAPVTVTFTGTSSISGSTFTWKDKNNVTLYTGATYPKYYTTNIQDEMTLIVTSPAPANCPGTFTDPNILIRGMYLVINPSATLSPPLGLCVNEGTAFTVDVFATLPGPPPPLYPLPTTSWLWDFGDGSATTTISSPGHTYTTVGDYNIKCVIITSNGCTDSQTIAVHADTKVPPSFYATPLAACTHVPITFYNTTVTSIPGIIYTWALQDSSFSTPNTGPPFTYGFPTVGAHDITLFTNHNGCVDFDKKQTYIDIHPPKAKYTYQIDCSPSLKVNFTNGSIGASSQSWNFGDGSAASTLSSPAHTYAASGKYYITLSVVNSTYGCTDSYLDSVNIVTTPLDFQASKTKVCFGDTLAFTTNFMRPGTTYFSWLIDTNAATPISQDNYLVYKFPTKGKHDVALIAQSGLNCIDTVWKRGYINVSQPEVHFYANPHQGCIPFKATFIDTSVHVPGVKASTQTWTFDGVNGASGILPTDTFTYYVPGDYTVKLVVTDDQNCSNSLERFQYIAANKPEAIFYTNDTIVCRGVPVNVTSLSLGKGIKHLWDFGDGTPKDTGFHPIHRYATTGNFSITLTVTDTIGCTNTLVKANYVLVTAPAASFTQSASLAICPPLIIQFTNKSLRADSSSWFFDNGSGPVSVTSPISTFSTPQLYNIRLIVYDINRCPDTATSVVRVLGYNGAFTYSPLKGCAPMVVNFQPPANGIPKIIWDFNDGVTQTTNGTGTTHVYTGTGVYLPNVIFSDGFACKASSIGVDSIYVDKVTADFSWSTPCVGTPFAFSDHSSAVFDPANSWLWHFSGTDTAHGPNPSYTYGTSGNHSVTLVASNATGCKDTITKQVLINPLPNIQTSPDKGLCPGDSTLLTVTGGKTY